MSERTINGQRFSILRLLKQSASSSLPVDQSSSNMSSRTAPPPSSSPPLPSPSIPTSQTLVKRTEVAPKSRIVVVRTTDEEGETGESNESSGNKPIELPARITNGRTSVYLIRRPIPPNDPPRQTILFDPPEDSYETTTTTTSHLQLTRTPTPTEEFKTSPSSPTQFRSPPIHPTTSKRRSSFIRSTSPILHSPTNNIHSESAKDLSSSPTQFRHSQGIIRRSRSRRRSLVHSDSKIQSTSKRRPRRLSPEQHSQTLPIPVSEEVPKVPDEKRTLYSFSRTKDTDVQANVSPVEIIEDDHRTIHNTRSRVARNTERRKSPIPRKTINLRKPSPNQRIKSAKSIIFVNPDDQTIAVIENSYLKGETTKPVIKHSKSYKTTQIHQEIVDNESTEKLIKTSRWHTCLGCLSRYMCLIIIICFILVVIGLAGVGVSAYFLATNNNSGSSTTPEIVGIAVGGLLAIGALCFFYCILACIGSRDGYFSYKDDGPRGGGRAYALIRPSHPNAHLYVHGDHSEVYEHRRTSLSSASIIRQQTIHRKKTVVNEINGIPNAKSFTIEMPERLLTGRKFSPKTHERQLNKVVNNIGYIVENTKKRYNDELPTKVIVKVDKNAKATA